MKLWYQNMSNIDLRPNYKKTLTEYVNKVADPGTVVECYGTPTGTRGVEYNSVRYLDVGWLLAAAITAERQGYDAFVIGNLFDAGIHELRELVNIPVIGHLETSLLLMSTMAKNFSIIVGEKKLGSAWEGLIEGYGFKDRLVSVASLDTPLAKDSVLPVVFEGMFTDKKFQADRAAEVMAHGKAAVAAGAEMIFILPGSIGLALEKQGITEIDGAPIFKSIPGLIKMAELMVKYREITGMFISRKHTYASPSKEIVDELIERHKLQIGDVWKGGWADAR
jgi:Asp/Glu/hydantoin racemase